MAKQFPTPAEAQGFVPHQRIDALGIELRDIGRRAGRGSRGVAALLFLDDKELPLDARYGPARVGHRLGGGRKVAASGTLRTPDADRADTVRAVAEQQSEIIFLIDMGDASLLLAEPALGAELLE